MTTGMKWQKAGKYAVVSKEFTHCQILKWNGTKGYPVMKNDNIGVYNEESGNYDFKEVKCSIYGNNVIPCFLGDFVRFFPHIFQLKDSMFDLVHDIDDKKLKERLEIRLHKAKSQMDIRVANLFYCAGQSDRLSIKEIIMRMSLTKIP